MARWWQTGPTLGSRTRCSGTACSPPSRRGEATPQPARSATGVRGQCSRWCASIWSSSGGGDDGCRRARVGDCSGGRRRAPVDDRNLVHIAGPGACRTGWWTSFIGTVSSRNSWPALRHRMCECACSCWGSLGGLAWTRSSLTSFQEAAATPARTFALSDSPSCCPTNHGCLMPSPMLASFHVCTQAVAAPTQCDWVARCAKLLSIQLLGILFSFFTCICITGVCTSVLRGGFGMPAARRGRRGLLHGAVDATADVGCS